MLFCGFYTENPHWKHFFFKKKLSSFTLLAQILYALLKHSKHELQRHFNNFTESKYLINK